MNHPSFRGSVLTALAVLTASAGLSACRLGANNAEKLSALKSGEIYDEDGVLTVSITSPAAGTLINLTTNSSNFAASGDCSPDASEITLAIDGTSLSGAPQLCADGKWSASFDSTSLSDGDHSLVATALRNGKSKASEAVAFKKDVAVPQLAILSPSNNGFINASSDSATFAISGTCTESGQTVWVKVDGSAASSQNGGSCNGATWAATINTLALPAGSHTLQVSIASSSGNAKTSDPIVVTKDITLPTVAISAPAVNAYVNLGNNSASFAASGTCDDATASVQFKVDGANSASAVACGGVNWSATFSTVALSQGAHTMTAVISDPAGNSATSSTVAITKDTVAPSVAVTSPSASSYVNIGNNSASFAIQGSCTTADENGRTITIQVNGSNASQSAIACGGSDAWSGTFNSTGLGQGAHTLTALISDAAGNSTTSSGIVVTKDTVAPTVTLTYPIAGMVINPARNTTTYSVKGTCSESSSVTIQVDGATASGVASNTCSSSAFNATIDVTGLSNAAHTITALQTDAAGNTNTTVPSVALTKDSASSMGATFARTSNAFDPYSGVEAASGVARYATVSSATGILMEETSTNLVTNTNGRPNDLTAAGTNPPTVTLISDATNPFGSQSWQVTYPASGDTTLYYGSRATSNTWTSAASTKYAMSVWIKGDTTGMYFYHTGAQGLGSLTPTGRTIGSWAEHAVVSTTTGIGGEYLSITFSNVNPTAAYGKTIYIAASKVEQKGFFTSYHSSGTRSSESLTVPTAGSIQATQGAAIVRAYVFGDVASATPNLDHFLWAPNLNNTGIIANEIGMFRGTDGRYYASTSTTNASRSSSWISGSSITSGWHIFGMRWSGTELALWIDGTKSTNVVTNPALPTTVPSTMAIGHATTVQKHWGNPIDYAAFYQHAPTDAEMTTYTSTGPSNADNRLDFNGANFYRNSAAHNPITGEVAASGAPRFVTTSDGTTGIAIEETSTNLFTYSQQLDTNAPWDTAANVSVSANAGVAPDGTTTAEKVIPDTNNTNHWLRRSQVITNGQAGTYSVYAKASGYTMLSIYSDTTSGAAAGIFDLSNGSVYYQGASVTAQIQTIGNGWYRCMLSTSVHGTTMGFGIRGGASAPYSYAGDGTSGILLWGAQAEQLNYPTSYIATTTASATRAPDVLSIPVEGHLTATSGKIRARIMLLATKAGIPQGIVDMYGSSASGFSLFIGDGGVNMRGWNSATNAFSAGLSATGLATPRTFHIVEGSWTATELNVKHNGTAGSAASFTNGISFPTSMLIGSWYTTPNRSLGGIIDWIEFENSDGTVKRYDFNNSLGQ